MCSKTTWVETNLLLLTLDCIISGFMIEVNFKEENLFLQNVGIILRVYILMSRFKNIINQMIISKA